MKPFFKPRVVAMNLPMPLKKGRAYTFFTPYGILQFGLLLILFLFAVNYNNNTSMLGLVFLLAVYMAAIVRNYSTLRSVTIADISSRHSVEGDEGGLKIRLVQKKIKPDYPLLHVKFDKTIVDVAFNEHGEAVVDIPFTKDILGVYLLPVFKIYSCWPFGVCQTWVYVKPHTQVVVLPIEYRRELHDVAAAVQAHQNPLAAASGDVEGTREIVKGEQGAKIAWKQTFRRNKMMTYTYEKSAQNVVAVVWPSDPSLSLEQKLRVVSGAVSAALSKEQRFQVQHPTFKSPTGSTVEDGQQIIGALMGHVLPVKGWRA